MGVRDLWTILTPFCERKPIYELGGKTVAIDLAGWVCESLNTVDYFVHPRQYLKNLFFRTCYLLLEGVTPVFVLEGKTPELKYQVVSNRNKLQFRGAKPKNTSNEKNKTEAKGRTRFNYVLKQCENLLHSMGLECVQAPGEAEAFCAFLNKKGLVDGVVSQDSDCFAYGAIRVYRNFSVSSQGNSAAKGGAVDIYDINAVKKTMDFGQNKVIAMALLCGCDYCPEGVDGIGKDTVIKLFSMYKDEEIIERIRDWKKRDDYYTSLEVKVEDKNICSNCGHSGRTVKHTRNGCLKCGSTVGCHTTLWKDQRLLIKAEMTLRRKALLTENFPSDEIIQEFLQEPDDFTKPNLTWQQPNLVKFITSTSNLLQWPQIYCFQKFLPILTRWQLLEGDANIGNKRGFLTPKSIIKKRTLKGVASYEVLWKDEKNYFANLIPSDQLKDFLQDCPKGIDSLWTTIEPVDLMQKTYSDVVYEFLLKQKKPLKESKRKNKNKEKILHNPTDNSLNDMNSLIEVISDIEKKSRKKAPRKLKLNSVKGLQRIDKFLIKDLNKESDEIKISSPLKPSLILQENCSTPKQILSKNKAVKTKNSFSIFTDDEENSNIDDENEFNFSDIIANIINIPVNTERAQPTEIFGKKLKYEEFNISKLHLNKSKDDLELIPSRSRKRNSSLNNSSFIHLNKRSYLHKSFENVNEMNMKEYSTPNKEFNTRRNNDFYSEAMDNEENKNFTNSKEKSKNWIDNFLNRENLINETHSKEKKIPEKKKRRISYFFDKFTGAKDEFENSLDFSFLNNDNEEFFSSDSQKYKNLK